MSQPDINHHSRPSSLRHQSLDDVKNTAKRYATYELNWRDDHDYNSINSIDDDHSQNNDTSTNSAQVARWSLPPKTPPPTIPLPPVPQDQLQYNDRHKHTSHHSRKSISPIVINTTRRPDPRDKRNSEPQSPFGGITVTTVKVVEILHSPTDENNSNNKSRQKNFRPEPLNLSAADPVGIITSEHKRRNHVSSLPPPPSTPQKHDAKKFRISEDPKILLNQQKKRSSIINPQKIRSNKRKGMNLNGKKPEMIIPKEMAFIDARLLAHNSLNSLVRTPTTNRNRKQIRKGGGSVYKKRTLPKNFELGPTSNPIYSNDPTDMEADLPPMKNQMYPWLPGSHKPPKLLHASLVPLPHRVNLVTKDITTKNNDISNNDSKININNVSRILSSVNPKRKSKVLSSNYNRLSRVNSQRKRRASIISQDPNRASLVFRRQILEESLMMSFSGMMMGGVGGVGIHQPQPLTPISKPPIRRKTKKVSAKVEDRETRRERRRKEKLEKKLRDAQNNDASNNNDDKSNVINDQIEGNHNIENKNGEEKVSESLEVNRIIEQSKVEKEIFIGPQPPPRKLSQDATVVDDHSPPPQKSKNNNSTLSLFASPSEQKLENSSSSSSLEPSTDEPPPFPAHLARSTSFFEHNSSEKSKRKQQLPYPPPLSSTPSSPISNHSRLIPSPLKGNELFNEEEPKHDSEETNSIQQPTSPLKSPKIGMGILGFFNKQTTKDSTSPPLSQINSPISHPTQLPPQSPTTPASLTLSTARTPPPTPTSSIHNPPLSPPLSPRTLRLPQQLSRVGRSRRGAETVPNSPSAVQDPEKLRKMEQFEALIASSETSSSKKPITEKIKAFTTAITTAASTATSSASSSIMTSNAGFEKRKKSTDATPYNTPRHSSEASFISADQRSRNSSSNNSLADSIYYNPEEKSELGKPGDDGVIRVTLTPAVCR